MNNALKLALVTCGLSIAGTSYYSPTESTPYPTATVEVLTAEASYEWLPSVTVEVVHEEVEIIDQSVF
tara:strand:- start:216 stop:419 length:204 start_codon:yes stop_codon:yes gene_type:complete